MESVGEGAFGQVFAGVHKNSSQQVAIKKLTKTRDGLSRECSLKKIALEADLIRRVQNCRGVVRLLEVFEDEDHAYMVEERCFGGDLEAIVTANGVLDEPTLRDVAREVMATLAACHAQGIVYADVRPTNFCVTGVTVPGQQPSVVGSVRAIDFGASRMLGQDQRLYTRTGTPAYFAPEVFDEDFGPKADVWATGIMLYQLYTRRLPYWDEHEVPAMSSIEDIETVVLQHQLSLDGGPWPAMSREGRDFIARRKHSKAAGALVARAATATESPVGSGSSDSDSRPRHRACFDEAQTTLLALPGASGASTDAEASSQHLHGTASNHISASADTTDAFRALSAVVDDLKRQIADDVAALRAMVESQKQQIEALTVMLQTSVTSPARLAAATAAPVASAAGAPAGARPAAAGAARAAPASSRAMRGLPAVAATAQRRHSFVATFSMEDATAFAACHDYDNRRVIQYLSCIDDDATVEVAAVAARQVAAAAATGVSLPVCLAESIVSHVQRGWRVDPAGGSVVSASLLNAKPASGGIGVVPRRGDVLRFTVTSDAVADTIVRYRCSLRCCANISTKTNIFVVLTDTEEAQRRALWPAFVAAKAAGKRAQLHRARLMIDGERVPPPACKSDN
ncbi:hypothetical protein FOA52_003681 [Chlamydomonas sp. UWO 241]|nr:hypothetical protein FOA52_003681 [Chlamydomonas sp. UWO 241]